MAAYFVALAFVFGSVLPLATEIPIIGRDIALILPMAQVQFVLGFSVYFVLGHLLHTGALRAVKTRWFVIALMLAVLVTVAGTAIRSVPKGVAEATLYGYLTPNVILMSICVFMIVKRIVERRGPEWRVGPVVGFIGGCSFGIYLVHPFFQSLLLSWGITSAVLPEVISVPLLSLAIFVPALVVAALLHRIPRVGRYIA
jgi:surface polysaccharide O-acyltransferase-like enzyme